MVDPYLHKLHMHPLPLKKAQLRQNMMPQLVLLLDIEIDIQVMLELNSTLK